MDRAGNGYVVGARLRALPAALHKKILDVDACNPLAGTKGRLVGEWDHNGRRLIVVWCPKRARKDAHERSKAVKRSLARLARGSNPRALLSNRGTGRFIAVVDDAQPTVDRARVAEAARWDGLAGVIANLHDIPATDVLAHDRGLWQVEESFRITKHDLRARPIRH